MTDVVGLDLSLTATGIACDGHTDVLKPPKGCAGMERLAWIRDRVVGHLKVPIDPTGYTLPAGPRPLVVIEDYSYNAGHGAHQLGELGGVIRLAMHTLEVPWTPVAPAALKKFATGRGNANKDAMLAAAIRAGYDGDSNDGADAWWLRQMGCYAITTLAQHRLAPLYAGLPTYTVYRDETVAKITWPDTLEAAS